MDAVEREIYQYLKPRRSKSEPARDISRHAAASEDSATTPIGPRRSSFAWLSEAFSKLTRKAFTASNLFRERTPKASIGPRPNRRNPQSQRQEFDNLITAEDEDAYYDKL